MSCICASMDIVKRTETGYEVVATDLSREEAEIRCRELNGGGESYEGGHWLRGKNGIPFSPPLLSRRRVDPPVGSWAVVARSMVEDGLMDADEADRWKDEMKEGGHEAYY